jgi:molybdopterin/thiamine biosynthesis adenylyltransferase
MRPRLPVSRDYSRLDGTRFAQALIRDLTVLVVGAGALGNEVLKNLALLGVGHVVIVDRDDIERSNLTRSILYCTSDIERYLATRTPKARFAAARVREINPDVRVDAVASEVADVGLGVFRSADVVVGCLDNELARVELAWACLRADRPLVDGGLGTVDASSGLVAQFPGASGPCYLCRLGPERRRSLLWELQGHEDPCWLRERRDSAAGVISTTPVMASIIGALQVEAALKLALHGAADPTEGTAQRVTIAPRLVAETTTFGLSPSCVLHESPARAEEVAARPDRASVSWSVRDMLDETLGADAGAILRLDWPLTVGARCGACGHDWEPLVRRARFRRSACPRCGASVISETKVVSEIGRDSPWADRPLAAIGLPSWHVHELVALSTPPRRVLVEVSGDRPAPPEAAA